MSKRLIKSHNRNLITTTISLTVTDQNLDQSSFTIKNTLLDTGSEITLGNLRYFRAKGIPYHKLDQILTISNALGTNMPPITHMTRGAIAFDNSDTLVTQVSVYLIDTPLDYNVIVGINVLYNLQLTILEHPLITLGDPTKMAQINPISLYDRGVHINNIQPLDVIADSDIISRQRYTVLPKSEQIIKTRTQKMVNRELCINSIKTLRPYVEISNRYIANRGFVTIWNNSNQIITIQKNAKIAFEDEVRINNILRVSNLQDFDQSLHYREYRDWKRHRQFLINTNDISGQIKLFAAKSGLFPKKVETLMFKFNSIFSRGDTDFAFNKNFICDFSVKEEHVKRPKYQPAFRMDYETSKKVELKLQSMLKAGIIEKAVSQYNSPLLAIQKKDKNSIRIVNSFVELNKHIEPVKFPIPNLEFMLFQLAQEIPKLRAQFGELSFICIDFANSFWNLSLKHDKRCFTSFIHNSSQYQFAKLSMGLSLAPSIYSKMLQTAIEELNIPNSKIFNYIDDVAILVPNCFALNALEQLFIWLQENCFVISINKLQLFVTQIDYLGFKVSMEGVHMDPKKLADLKNLKMPNTITQAQMLAGLVNFNCHMIPWLQYYLTPIHADIGAAKNRKFTLSEASRRAIEKIKSLAHQDHFLHHINYDHTIFVATDASLLGYGMALGNCKLDPDQKLIYDIKIARLGSKPFTVQESLLSSRARELIALGQSVEYFSKYIPRTKHIVLITDHLSLADMTNNMKKTIHYNRVRKSISSILEYDFEIIFLPNSDPLISLVDLASRQFTYVPHKFTFTLDDLNIRHTKINNLNYKLPLKEQHTYVDIDQIRIAQKDDTKCKIILAKSGNIVNEVILDNRQEFVVKDNLVFKVMRDTQLYLYIPATIDKQLLQYMHMIAGHQGFHRIINLVDRNQFYILDKKRLVREITSNCLYCAFLRPKVVTKVSEKAKPALIPSQSFAVDLLDMVSYKNDNVRYLLTMMDIFSRYVLCLPLKSKNALEVAQQLIILCMQFNAFSAEIISDNAKEFKNNHLMALTEQLGIQLSFISSRNARANIIERAHRQINELMKSQNVKPDDLLLHCNIAVHTYNHQANRGQDMLSPFEIRFGQASQLGLCYPSLITDNDPDYEPESRLPPIPWIEFLRKYHLKIGLQKFQHAQSIIGPTIEKYDIGDLVTAFLPNLQSPPKNERFDYIGPFIVKSRCRNTYKLQHLWTGNILTRHFRFMRKLNVTEQMAQQLKENHIRILADNTIEPLELPVNTAPLPLRAEEEEAEEVPEIAPPHHYNLRKRS